MDYSSSLHDENPAEASPWGSNSPTHSPKPSRTSFGAGFGAPDSPNMTGQTPSYGRGDSFASDSGMASETATPQLNSGGFGQRPSTAGSTASEQQDYQQPAEPQQQYYRDENQPPQESQRLHPHSRPTTASRPQPHYKLVAKITGLERTGRKDPILRFDVHVSAAKSWQLPRYC